MSDKPANPAARKAQGRKKKPSPSDQDGAAGLPVPAGQADPGPPEGFKALALDYPFALVAGGVAVGVLIGALLPRRQASRLSRPLLAAVGAASEFGLAYAQKAMARAADAAHEASVAGGQLLTAAAERTDDLAEATADRASDYGERAAALAAAAPAALRGSGQRIAREVVRLTSHLRH